MFSRGPFEHGMCKSSFLKALKEFERSMVLLGVLFLVLTFARLSGLVKSSALKTCCSWSGLDWLVTLREVELL